MVSITLKCIALHIEFTLISNCFDSNRPFSFTKLDSSQTIPCSYVYYQNLRASALKYRFTTEIVVDNANLLQTSWTNHEVAAHKLT
jgi:hypothetical protein